MVVRPPFSVITHDFRLDPSFTKDKEGNWIENENIRIFDLTYEELSRFDVGSLNKLSRYGRRFINQKTLNNYLLFWFFSF